MKHLFWFFLKVFNLAVHICILILAIFATVYDCVVLIPTYSSSHLVDLILYDVQRCSFLCILCGVSLLLSTLVIFLYAHRFGDDD